MNSHIWGEQKNGQNVGMLPVSDVDLYGSQGMDTLSVSGSSDSGDSSNSQATPMMGLTITTGRVKSAVDRLNAISGMHPEFTQLARLITSASSVTAKMKESTTQLDALPRQRRFPDSDTRMTPDVAQSVPVETENGKSRKNVREKQRRQEIQQKFDVLCDLLGLEDQVGTNGKPTKPDKTDILTATITHLNELQQDNKSLQEEKVVLATELFTLANQLDKVNVGHDLAKAAKHTVAVAIDKSGKSKDHHRTSSMP
jgi:hypothetical protein